MRRRVNVLFPNPQSLFDGLHVRFVNVTAGNLTFRRRDVVRNADGPVVFARVYDPRIAANPDFGPGWRLSLAEELVVDEAGLIHVDRSGARHRFSADGHGYVADPPTLRHAGTRVTVSADGAVMREGDGTVRVFHRSADGGTFRIAKVEAAGRRLDFGYADGLLATISRDGRTLFDIRRGGDGGGLIAAVTDGHERTVSYSYARGLLKDVADLAGNIWWHEYDRDGRLTAAVGANRKPYLRVSYDARGRVVESLTGREYAYDYSRRRTTVTEGSGQRHAFERDAAGVTVALRSSNGTRWRIGLDRENRVEILETPDRTVVYGYDAERDRAGDLTALREGGRAVFFSRDAFGRITDAAYPDGTANRYFHDALGNRTRVEFGAGGAARYRHDAAGNIVQVDVTELDGSTKRQTVTIGDMNRVERIDYEGSHTLRVDYDRMGRPVTFATGEDTVTAEYTALGRLARLSSAATGEVSAFGDDGLAVGSPGKADRRRTALSGDVVGEAQPGYGAVGIAETTFEAVPRDPVEAGVPGLAAARALAAVAGPLFADGSAGMADFEKPSNPVFQPPEYRATNCCMPFACEFCAPTGGGFCYGGGGGGQTCDQAQHHRSRFITNWYFEIQDEDNTVTGYFPIKLMFDRDEPLSYHRVVFGAQRWNGTYTIAASGGNVSATLNFEFKVADTSYALMVDGRCWKCGDASGMAVQGGNTMSLDPHKYDERVVAHEFGHILGFGEAYNAAGPLPCHVDDVMGNHPSGSVHAYHAQVLVENY